FSPGSHAHTALRRADKVDQVPHLRRTFPGGDGVEGMSEVLRPPKEDEEGVLELANLRGAEAGAAQPNAIDGTHRMRAIHDAEGGDVAAGGTQAAQQRQPADTHELMNDAVAGHKCLIPNLHVSTQRCPGRHDDAILNPAIVADMGDAHEEVVV